MRKAEDTGLSGTRFPRFFVEKIRDLGEAFLRKGEGLSLFLFILRRVEGEGAGPGRKEKGLPSFFVFRLFEAVAEVAQAARKGGLFVEAQGEQIFDFQHRIISFLQQRLSSRGNGTRIISLFPREYDDPVVGIMLAVPFRNGAFVVEEGKACSFIGGVYHVFVIL